jgi:hypothetical protein
VAVAVLAELWRFKENIAVNTSPVTNMAMMAQRVAVAGWQWYHSIVEIHAVILIPNITHYIPKLQFYLKQTNHHIHFSFFIFIFLLKIFKNLNFLIFFFKNPHPVEKIAFEKSGIVRPSVPLVTPFPQPGCVPVFATATRLRHRCNR